MSSLGPVNERLLYHAIEGVSPAEIQSRVQQNAPLLNIDASHEIQNVVATLVDYYQTNVANDQCQNVHHNLRFLEQAFANQGGGKYLETLFPPGEGIIHSIHILAGLPPLQMDADPGVGSIL